MKIEYIVMDNTHENAMNAERMRYQSYGVKNIEKIDAEYLEDIKEGSVLVFLCLVDDKPVAACYISNYNNTLFVEYLFTLAEYQRKQLYYGKNLLQYILDNKKIVEEYFECTINQSLLYPANNNVIPLYESLGYKIQQTSDLKMTKEI